jgi:hypothetical protein
MIAIVTIITIITIIIPTGVIVVVGKDIKGLEST